jgi:single-strand DNA-binding protein
MTASVNKVFLLGRTTKDPELRYTPKGTAIVNTGLAINRVWNEEGEKKTETTFVDITLWGRQAEVAGQYLKKGRSVFIEGRLHLDTWDDKQSGQKRSRLTVVGESLQFLDSRPESEGPSSSARSSGPPQRPQPQDPLPDVQFDDIPF